MNLEEDIEIQPVCISGVEPDIAIDRWCDLKGNRVMDRVNAFYIDRCLPGLTSGFSAVAGYSLLLGELLAASMCFMGILSMEYMQRGMQNDVVKDIVKYDREMRKR